MRQTEDGFVIAEEDLRLRGGGEMLGTRQSGVPLFRIASLPEHQALLEAARDQARLTLARDPELKGDDAESAETAALSVRAGRRDQADARRLTPESAQGAPHGSTLIGVAAAEDAPEESASAE